MTNNQSFNGFEQIYAEAGEDFSRIPWVDLAPNPNLVEWLDRNPDRCSGRALVIGCGVGDDAEELARRGYEVTAFDISPTAITRCRERFPDSSVTYLVADLLNAPPDWRGTFDFVLEVYTLQSLPLERREQVIACVASWVAPGGGLLLIARGRDDEAPPVGSPVPLTRRNLSRLCLHGLKEQSFEDYMDAETPPVRRFRAVYRRN